MTTENTKLCQCDRPQGSPFGISSGTGGGFHAGPKPASMPCTERDALCSAGAPRPNGFTGVWGGVHYYKGCRWEGDTNAVGYGKIQAVCVGSGTWGVRTRREEP